MKQPVSHWQRAFILTALTSGVSLGSAAAAGASSFEGRLAVGPSYLSIDTRDDFSDSAGPALSLQLDAGLRLVAPLTAYATLFYDVSSWMDNPRLLGRQDASVLGLGLGTRLHLASVVAAVAAGAQFTSFPQTNDPLTPYAAGVGPFLLASAGYEWALGTGASRLGVHAQGRVQRSPDETNATVYDPIAYQLGLALSLGLDGEALYAP